MIQPTTPLTIPQVNAQTADGIWINRIIINAPSPTSPITANVLLTPFNIESGSMFPELNQNLQISDVLADSVNSPELLTAFNSICSAVQGQIISQSLFQ